MDASRAQMEADLKGQEWLRENTLPAFVYPSRPYNDSTVAPALPSLNSLTWTDEQAKEQDLPEWPVQELPTWPPLPERSQAVPRQELPAFTFPIRSANESQVSPRQRLKKLPRAPTFDPDDYAVDGEIPKHLLSRDNWLPDPPEQPIPKREKDFTKHLPKGNAVLTYTEHDGSIGRVDNLHLDIIETACPLIAAAFEASDRQYRLHLDVLTPLSARPFVRYLYCDSYAEVDARYEEIPSSVLLHCQLHFLGGLFDMGELKSQALVNVLRQCEFACFSPEQPIDLCAALRYCYDHIEYSRGPLDNIIAYCIERFTAHGLGTDSIFRELAYSHRPFHHDLIKALKERGYKDEAAQDILRLPFAPPPPPSVDALYPRQRQMHQPHSPLSKRPLLQTAEPEVTSPPPFARSAVASQPDNHPSGLTLALRGKGVQVEDGQPPSKRARSMDGDFVIVDSIAAVALSETGQCTSPSPHEQDFVLLPRRTEEDSGDESAGFTAINTPRGQERSSSTATTPLTHSPVIVSPIVGPGSPPSDSDWVLT